MAKVPGFMRPREKIDEAELERVRIRTLERLVAIFGDTAASLETPADLPAATGQPPTAQAPRDPDPPASTEPLGAPSPPTLAERRPDLVGVMAKPQRLDVEAAPEPDTTTMLGVVAGPERPGLEAPPEPDAPTMVGVMERHGPATKVGSTDDWRSRADAYILGVAFGVARGPMPGRGADSAVRIETRRADAIRQAPSAGSVDLRREGPRAVEQVDAPVLRKVHAHRPGSASDSRS